MREQIKKNVSEKKRKDKKAAKKDVTWRSREWTDRAKQAAGADLREDAGNPKDIGVPNSIPFRDQIIAEALAEKQRVSQSSFTTPLHIC